MTGVEQIKVDEERGRHALGPLVQSSIIRASVSGRCRSCCARARSGSMAAAPKSDIRACRRASLFPRAARLGVDRKVRCAGKPRATMRGVEDARRPVAYPALRRRQGSGVRQAIGPCRAGRIGRRAFGRFHAGGLAQQEGREAASRPPSRPLTDTSGGGWWLPGRGWRAMKLAESFKKRETKKTYWALVKGVPKQRGRARSPPGFSRSQHRMATACGSPSTAKKGRGSCRDPITGWSSRRARPCPRLEMEPYTGPHAPACAYTPPTSTARSSAIRNISRPTRTGTFRAGLSERAAPPCAPDRHPASRQGHESTCPRPCRPICARSWNLIGLDEAAAEEGGLSQPLSVFEKAAITSIRSPSA